VINLNFSNLIDLTLIRTISLGSVDGHYDGRRDGGGELNIALHIDYDRKVIVDLTTA
jgi:hypothetical protein